ncbi:ribosome biogenesis GTPase Der [Helicobacter monodelphidis]|uniref:ribosome biogenesis GTPase Der n=1 Tax=Helicobacter sp. 15-1451 TaxID=2004995 RepID=UPI000DCD8397|nr:ribosome biogenesis GTPase Der [Helicobacter sp. 15-1451]RAX58171.1 ribosome biogenesis GTPase Der [Helicobacter sp. 15-1451]
MKKIAIIGRPNVGKSSLFNRFLQSRKAITSDLAGTTHDVKRDCIELEGLSLSLSDTGGIEERNHQETMFLFKSIKEQALKEAGLADLILFVVDGKLAPLDEDLSLFRDLQKLKIPLFLVVNKLDNAKEEERIHSFVVFGISEIFAVSITHNRGFAALKSAIIKVLNIQPLRYEFSDGFMGSLEEEMLSLGLHQDKTQEEEYDEIKTAIIGRVNVGKSSLLNALLGEERSIVSEVAGTTIDPIDESFYYEGKKLTFIDTAGLRRKGKIEGIEKYALQRTREMLDQHAHIALLVLDASAPLVELDEKIGSLVLEYGLGVVIVLNKWDVRHKEIEEIKKDIKERFKYLSYAPIVTISAKNKKHIMQLKEAIIKVYQQLIYRIPTAMLNKTILDAYSKHPIPSKKGKIVRIYYATQYKIAPPHISLVMNRPKALHFSYKRYLINQLRKEFGFSGVPIFIEAKKKGERSVDGECMQEEQN